jgi:hypothetical protein
VSLIHLYPHIPYPTQNVKHKKKRWIRNGIVDARKKKLSKQAIQMCKRAKKNCQKEAKAQKAR